MNQLFNDRKILFIFLSIFIVVVVIGSIIIINIAKPNNISTSSTPTPPAVNFNPAISPPKPPVAYNENNTQKMLNILKNRPTLSSSDSKIKNTLINSLPNQSGILNRTDDYILQYVKTPDEFMTEILTSDINKGKQEAVEWLKSKGMSQTGICSLPLVFYINWSTAQSLKSSNISFNPLPEGC